MKDLFRKEALENISSGSDITKGVRTVSIRTAVFIMLLVLCAAIFLIWLFFGTIYETVSVSGIIWSSKSGGAIYTESGGIVSRAVTASGNTVKAGDILAVIVQEDILSKIEDGKLNGISDAELKKLYDEYDKNSIIRSNVNGIVTHIAGENSYIPDGGKIAEIVPYDESDNNQTLTAFIPAKMGGLITLGMEVQVMPDFAPREQYGYINAYISEIASYPVTGQYIKDNKSELFLSTIDERESYLQLEITLMPDAQAQSHLKWSNPKSGDIDAPMGTMCEADIVIEKCRPYEWLF